MKKRVQYNARDDFLGSFFCRAAFGKYIYTVVSFFLFSERKLGGWRVATVGVGKLGKRNEIGMVMVWRLEGMLEQSLVKITTATEFKN